MSWTLQKETQNKTKKKRGRTGENCILLIIKVRGFKSVKLEVRSSHAQCLCCFWLPRQQESFPNANIVENCMQI